MTIQARDFILKTTDSETGTASRCSSCFFSAQGRTGNLSPSGHAARARAGDEKPSPAQSASRIFSGNTGMEGIKKWEISEEMIMK